MKSVIIAFVAIFCLSFLPSCMDTTPVAPQSTLVEQQVNVVQPEFFYVVKQVVKGGDTVWDRARITLGSGYKWRDVVAQNKFLQQPGRVWQDKATGIWYVLIYPGEELIMGSETINPVFIDTVDAQTSNVKTVTPVVNNSEVNWWKTFAVIGLVLIALIALINLLNYYRPNALGSFANSSSSSAVNVNVENGGDIALATRTAIIEDRQFLRQDCVDIIRKGVKKNRVKEFTVIESDELFIANASFRRDRRYKTPQTEDKK